MRYALESLAAVIDETWKKIEARWESVDHHRACIKGELAEIETLTARLKELLEAESHLKDEKLA